MSEEKKAPKWPEPEDHPALAPAEMRDPEKYFELLERERRRKQQEDAK